MPKILITKDAVSDATNKIATAGSDHDAALTAIKNVVNALNSGWEGNAKDAFNQVWTKEGRDFESFRGDITKFSQFLKAYLQKMESEDVLR